MRAYPFALADESGIKVMKVKNWFASNRSSYAGRRLVVVMTVTKVHCQFRFGSLFMTGNRDASFKMYCGRVLNEGKKETHDQRGVVSQRGIDLLPANKTL